VEWQESRHPAQSASDYVMTNWTGPMPIWRHVDEETRVVQGLPPGAVHEEAHLLDHIGQVQTGECQVVQRPSKAAVFGRVDDGHTGCGEELEACQHAGEAQ